jgi:hypothetical protein
MVFGRSFFFFPFSSRSSRGGGGGRGGSEGCFDADGDAHREVAFGPCRRAEDRKGVFFVIINANNSFVRSVYAHFFLRHRIVSSLPAKTNDNTTRNTRRNTLAQVLGFREAMTNPDYQKSGSKFGIAPKVAAGAAVALFALACAFGTKIGGFEAHSPFLYGIGNLPEEAVLSLPFGELRSFRRSPFVVRLSSFSWRGDFLRPSVFLDRWHRWIDSKATTVRRRWRRGMAISPPPSFCLDGSIGG